MHRYTRRTKFSGITCLKDDLFEAKLKQNKKFCLLTRNEDVRRKKKKWKKVFEIREDDTEKSHFQRLNDAERRETGANKKEDENVRGKRPKKSDRC